MWTVSDRQADTHREQLKAGDAEETTALSCDSGTLKLGEPAIALALLAVLALRHVRAATKEAKGDCRKQLEVCPPLRRVSELALGFADVESRRPQCRFGAWKAAH